MKEHLPNSARELATITANSETGFSNPKYSDELPQALADAGMSQDSWAKFIARANEAVKFKWGIGSIFGFLFNSHNKKVARNMEKFSQDAVTLLPGGLAVSYRMVTEKKLVKTHVANSGGYGATLETYHKLIFQSSVHDT